MIADLPPEPVDAPVPIVAESEDASAIALSPDSAPPPIIIETPAAENTAPAETVPATPPAVPDDQATEVEGVEITGAKRCDVAGAFRAAVFQVAANIPGANYAVRGAYAGYEMMRDPGISIGRATRLGQQAEQLDKAELDCAIGTRASAAFRLASTATMSPAMLLLNAGSIPHNVRQVTHGDGENARVNTPGAQRRMLDTARNTPDTQNTSFSGNVRDAIQQIEPLTGAALTIATEVHNNPSTLADLPAQFLQEGVGQIRDTMGQAVGSVRSLLSLGRRSLN